MTLADAEAAFDRTVKVEQLPLIPDDDEWYDLAACREAGPDDKRMFIPDGRGTGPAQHADALIWRYCAQCPVTQQCRLRRYQTGAVGVWGGVRYRTEDGYQACLIAACTMTTTSVSPYCGFEHWHAAASGTVSGYRAHQTYGVPPCPPCQEAKRRRAEGARALARAGIWTNTQEREIA